MTKRTLPSQEYLRQCFEYDPQTGVLRWRARPLEHFKRERDQAAWNAKFAGHIANTMHVRTGYQRVSVCGGRRAAHRVIWKMAYNEEPEEIDHINRVRDDNRLVNLRAATVSQNRSNTPKRVSNKSGLKGVHACNGRWRAMIRQHGQGHHIGMFDTAEEAHAAYCDEARRRFGSFATT